MALQVGLQLGDASSPPRSSPPSAHRSASGTGRRAPRSPRSAARSPRGRFRCAVRNRAIVTARSGLVYPRPAAGRPARPPAPPSRGRISRGEAEMGRLFGRIGGVAGVGDHRQRRGLGHHFLQPRPVRQPGSSDCAVQRPVDQLLVERAEILPGSVGESRRGSVRKLGRAA